MSAHGSIFGEPGRAADREEMKRFLNVVFKRCAGVAGWVALRAFEHEGEGKVSDSRWAKFGADLTDYAVLMATDIASLEGARRSVFAPPVCLFGDMENDKGRRVASAANVVCGPVVAVELDERPRESLGVLEGLLGPATLIVASGGLWEGQQKLHVYWRLREPARDADALRRLYRVRALACRLVGADATGVSVAHPMRWPGSWHTKSAPVLCRIEGGESERDIELDWALGVLEAQGIDAGESTSGFSARKGFKTDQAWPAEALMDAARLIPNADVAWARWNTVGMAFWDASWAGSEGLEAFHAWSEKDGQGRYDPDVVDARWSHWGVSPPSDLSGGTLLVEMRKVDPDYRLSVDVAALWFETPSSSPEFPDSPPTAEKIGENVFGGEDASAPPFVRELNREHAFVMNRGQAIIVNEEWDGSVSFSSQASFVARYSNAKLRVGKRDTTRGEEWWQHPQRRQYLRGVEFDPDGVAPGVFNLWRGLPSLRGDEGKGEAGCALVLRHLREVVCAGDEVSWRYLRGWLAHMVQKPGEKPGVAVVLRGGKGAGKDTLGEYVREMLGPYYMHADAPEKFMGRFNAHLATSLFLHVEEAAWQGSKTAEGKLKSLVTAPVLGVEDKGVKVVLIKSRVRIMMTSNEDYVVPASADERRWFVLDVSSHRAKQREWFGPLRAELEGDGPACLRRYLASVDLSGFDVRDVPHTEGLSLQQDESLEGFDRFWKELLDEGTAFTGEDGGSWEEGPVSVPRDTVRRAFEDWCKRTRYNGHSVSANAIGRKLVDFTGVERDKLSFRPRSENGARVWNYLLPALGQCRSAWEKRFGR